MTIPKDALNCGEPKGGLKMSLSNWDKVCSEATDGPWLSLLSPCAHKGEEREGWGQGEGASSPPSPLHLHPETSIVRSPCTDTGRRDGGWEKAAAPGSSGDQTAPDSSILLLPGRVLMWRESSLKPWAPLSVSGVSCAAKSPVGGCQWQSGRLGRNLLVLYFPPIFLLEQWGESDSYIRG